MLKIVLDTNIYISAILFGGKPKKILELINEVKIHSFVSPEILLEINQVLRRKKFGFSFQEANEIIKEIEITSKITYPDREYYAVERDKKDNIIIDCAMKAEVDTIITGDSGLLDMIDFRGIKILKPAKFLTKFF